MSMFSGLRSLWRVNGDGYGIIPIDHTILVEEFKCEENLTDVKFGLGFGEGD